MDQPVDLIITLPEKASMPKIIQRFTHDLDLLLDAFERADTPFPIRVHRMDVHTPPSHDNILDRYKITQPNLVLAASPQNGTRIIFRYKDEKGSNPYDSSQAFRSTESLARQAIWEGGLLFRLARGKEWSHGTWQSSEERKLSCAISWTWPALLWNVGWYISQEVTANRVHKTSTQGKETRF
jgi:hypothetical protein